MGGEGRPAVCQDLTVDAVVFTVTTEENKDPRRLSPKVLRLLMVRRGIDPYKGEWALPGGFVRATESLDQAVDRELQEETGLSQIYLEQLYSWGDVDRDPRRRVVSVSYLALVDSTGLQLQAGDDAAAAEWFVVQQELVRTERVERSDGYQMDRTVTLQLSGGKEELKATLVITRTVQGRAVRTTLRVVEATGIAFDHARIILYALERLRNKIEWSAIAFSLVPPLFTMGELQQVYEVILGRELLSMQFRRDMERRVLPTNEMRTNVGHRPARLYRFNPDWME